MSGAALASGRMSRATIGRLTLLGNLYFAQGLPFGFFVQALPVLLRDAGYSLGEIAIAIVARLYPEEVSR